MRPRAARRRPKTDRLALKRRASSSASRTQTIQAQRRVGLIPEVTGLAETVHARPIPDVVAMWPSLSLLRVVPGVTSDRPRHANHAVQLADACMHAPISRMTDARFCTTPYKPCPR